MPCGAVPSFHAECLGVQTLLRRALVYTQKSAMQRPGCATPSHPDIYIYIYVYFLFLKLVDLEPLHSCNMVGLNSYWLLLILLAAHMFGNCPSGLCVVCGTRDSSYLYPYASASLQCSVQTRGNPSQPLILFTIPPANSSLSPGVARSSQASSWRM